MSALVLDAGALIALENGRRDVAAQLQYALGAIDDVLTTSMVLAQVWRGGSGRQAPLAAYLQQMEVLGIDEHLGRRTGELLGVARTSDAIDASLVLVAEDGDRILTSDPDDLRRLADAAGRRVTVVGC